MHLFLWWNPSIKLHMCLVKPAEILDLGLKCIILFFHLFFQTILFCRQIHPKVFPAAVKNSVRTINQALIAFIDRTATQTQTQANRNSKSLYAMVRATNNTFYRHEYFPTHRYTHTCVQWHWNIVGNSVELKRKLSRRVWGFD